MMVAKEYDMVAWIVVVIALGTGMRLAEIFGLSWNCIDFIHQNYMLNKVL